MRRKKDLIFSAIVHVSASSCRAKELQIQRILHCLLCYCPLYLLGDECGGNFEYLPNGIKNCSNCTLPHCREGYAHVMNKYLLIAERIRKKPRCMEA
ncbi:MAG: cysteine-rich small domain-containing protein [Eubacterium sp.]